ncbi:UDP-N-acetylmuramoyl-L-alanyl-D-glutamate--2,6-diaminopimelate ligase [Tepidibacter formicigenes]|jgi:UDP-N-acetylmuramoyl-L-alanyl-D-glutamate--2,6-diaminopimelate ligase|uniref:UDP-N-acetylmuramoyl-L-alanyl-D-glutamate--2,6-diaminopimelate ligase n=1 Tax=Tepidibacter formicigenes DSM 15518 TaxID=1123349 RepID=A0A1M6KBD4_9FIRM|nr:UDP-N-acetylmuramoyl-L-alanyl-D-glutamate--2,6-diaminopimelate ligase [Tepidibacter formicigenes]SHJ56298.1 UDP-N-acetylmuramoylalanyl-D-glutamate--2,6-diaminopimelate ligase [Tepidibacter formicigenes DSM 15518]
MNLKDIIKGLDIVNSKGNIEVNIEDIHYDSRKVNKNSLFICIKGFSVDGHKFIQDAISKGSIAFIVEDDVYIDGYTFIKVKDTRKAMAKISSNFFNEPTKDLNLIGVTGTNGKTTITHLLKDVLEHNNENVGLIGTIKNIIGDREIISSRTTPESIELQNYFREMINNNNKYCVMEVSSHSLELSRVDNCEFKIGIFTNLTEDHLDFHKDLNDYRIAKEKLFYKTTIGNVINIDDEGGKKIYKSIKNLEVPVLTYGIEEDANIKAKDIKIYPNGVEYKLITPEYKADIYVPISGRFTVYNSLAVIGACYLMNISKEIIIEGLKNTKGVPGRFENINSSKGFNVIVDYAHTPDALENILKTAKEFVNGKIITVFGCGGDRDKTKRPLMGRISQKYSDFTIVTSDNPRTETPINIIKDILKGMDDNKQNYEIVVDRKAAINKAINIARSGDIVIIAGKGHEDYQVIGKEKIHFDDKEVVKEILGEE